MENQLGFQEETLTSSLRIKKGMNVLKQPLVVHKLHALVHLCINVSTEYIIWAVYSMCFTHLFTVLISVFMWKITRIHRRFNKVTNYITTKLRYDWNSKVSVLKRRLYDRYLNELRTKVILTSSWNGFPISRC